MAAALRTDSKNSLRLMRPPARKKAKYAVFCGSDKVAGKLERGRHIAVLNLFHFHEFSDLILLKT